MIVLSGRTVRLCCRIFGAVPILLIAGTCAGQTSKELAPPVTDLRPQFERYGIDVRQQGRRGACQVMAMVGVMEFDLARRGKPVDLSEQFLMWAANAATERDRVRGFNPDLLIAGLQRHGICEESLMPYVPRNEPLGKPSATARKDAMHRAHCKVVSIKHWSWTPGFGDAHFKAIIGHLEKGHPVTVTLCWPDGLDDKTIVDDRHFIVDKNIDGKSKDGHGVILVGHGIDENCPGGGYFILRNSWGPNFADQGYAKVTFDFARRYGTDAYIVTVE